MGIKRVEFSDETARRQFFAELKENCKAKSWRALAERFGLRRTAFQLYQYGESTIPETLFEEFLSFFRNERAEFYRRNVEFKDWNGGRVLGGKRLYKLHPEIFENGRRIAIKNNRERGPKADDFDLNVGLSDELCEFIGAFVGDGFAGKYGHSYVVELSGDGILDKDYLMNFHAPNIKRLLGVENNVFFRKDSRGMRVRFHSKFLFRLLTVRFGFPTGVKCYSVVIPEEIMSADKKFLFAAIRGVFDTDGCVFIDRRPSYARPYPRIAFITVSEKLFFQLKGILGRYFSIYTRKSELNGVQRFRIVVYGRKQLVKWMGLIGFSNERHLAKVRSLSPEWDSNPRPADVLLELC